MRSIDHLRLMVRPLFQFGFLAVLACGLGACSFVLEKKVPEIDNLKQDAALQPAPEEINPYQRNRSKVSNKAQQRFVAATVAMQEQNWPEAEQHLQWLIENYPRYSGPLVNLAAIYRQAGKAEQAETIYLKAIAVNPSNLDAYNELAILLREQGRFQEAETQYQQALSVWSDYPQTHLNLGILYDLYMGRFSDALHHYQRYQELQAEPDRRVAGWIADLQRRADRFVAEAK